MILLVLGEITVGGEDFFCLCILKLHKQREMREIMDLNYVRKRPKSVITQQ